MIYTDGIRLVSDRGISELKEFLLRHGNIKAQLRLSRHWGIYYELEGAQTSHITRQAGAQYIHSSDALLAKVRGWRESAGPKKGT